MCQDSAGWGEDIQEEVPIVGCCREKVMGLGLDLNLMSGGWQENLTQGPLPATGPREEAPFVYLRAKREPLGRAAHIHSDHQGAEGNPPRASLEESLQ